MNRDLAHYRTMQLIRRAEEKIREHYRDDGMKTPVHLCIGQEQVTTGVLAALAPEDQLLGTYRSHALYLARTNDTKGFFAELYGRATGPARGKAGSMHLSSPEHGFLGTSAVVGTTIPLALGAAVANRQRGSRQRVAVFFGDGAVDEGVFWETLNFAALERLPIVFVCEDNGLAIHTPDGERHGYESLARAASGFRVRVASSDSTDPEEIARVTAEGLEGEGPVLLHFRCYRYLEHVGINEDFDAGYRPRAEYEAWLARDPIELVRTRLFESGARGEVERIDRQIETDLDEAVRLAQAAPFPSADELSTDVFAPPVEVASRSAAPRTMSYREALNEAIAAEMERDPTVFVFGLDVQDHKHLYGTTKGLVARFGPERCFGTPLSEDAMTGLALGAAISGLRPIHVHIRVDFLLLAVNQILNMISNYRYVSGGKVKVPLVIRAIIGRGWGQGAQHSKSLHSLFAHVPGLKVVLPTTPDDARGLLAAAIRDDDPVIVIEHRWLYDVVGEVTAETIPLGKARVRREGKDATVVATSWMNVEALHAAEILARRGVELEVIDPRTVVPLDLDAIVASVERTGHCVVADNDWAFCGFSAEIAAAVSERAFGKLRSPVARIGFAHAPCPTTRPLENLFYPNAGAIVRAVEKALGLSPTDLSGETFTTYENRFRGPF